MTVSRFFLTRTQTVLQSYRLGAWGAAVLRPYRGTANTRCERCVRRVREDNSGR